MVFVSCPSVYCICRVRAPHGTDLFILLVLRRQRLKKKLEEIFLRPPSIYIMLGRSTMQVMLLFEALGEVLRRGEEPAV